MKSLEDVQKAIDQTLSEGLQMELDSKERKKKEKEYNFYKQAKLVLETIKSEEDLEIILQGELHKLNVLDEKFKGFSRPPKFNGDLYGLWRTKNNYKAIEDRIKIYTYLL